MSVRAGAVKLKGNPVDLAGSELKTGDQAPDFTLQNTALEDVSLSSSQGKTRIIATIPSLDTSVCHAETKKFNDEAGSLANVEILVVSMDLPFGQKRWCGSEGRRRLHDQHPRLRQRWCNKPVHHRAGHGEVGAQCPRAESG